MLNRMTREALGEFEQLVLLAVIRLTAADAGEVYGVPIVEEIEKRTKRKVSRAAVYVALRRLEHKGLVATWMGDPSQERGGKARRCVRATRTGIQVLRESREAMNEMWHGLDPRLEKIR